MSFIPNSFNLNDALPKAAPAYRRKVRAAPQPNNSFTQTNQIIIPLDTTTNGCFLDTQGSYLEFLLTLGNTNPYIDYHSFGNAGASAVFEKMEIQVNNITIETLDRYSRAVSMLADVNGTASDDFDMFVSRPNDECVDSLYNRLNLNAVKKPMVDRSGRIMHANTWANSFGVGETQAAYVYPNYTNTTDSSKKIFPTAGISRGDINYITGQVGLAYQGAGIVPAAGSYGVTGTSNNCSTFRGPAVVPSDDNPLCWPEMIKPCVLGKDRNVVNHNSRRYHNQLTTLCNVRNVPIGCRPLVLPSTGVTTGNITANAPNGSIALTVGTTNQDVPPSYPGFYNWTTWITATNGNNGGGGYSESTCFTPGSYSVTAQVPLYSGFMGVFQEKHLPLFMCGDLKIVATLTTDARFFTVTMDPCRRIFGTHRDWCPYQGNTLNWRGIGGSSTIGYPANVTNYTAYTAYSGLVAGSVWNNTKLANSLGSSGVGLGNILPWNSFYSAGCVGYASATVGWLQSQAADGMDTDNAGEGGQPNISLQTDPESGYFNTAPYFEQWQSRFPAVFSPQMYKAGSHIPQYFLPSLNQTDGWVTVSGTGTTGQVPANCWVPGNYLQSFSTVVNYPDGESEIVFLGYDGEQCFGTFLQASVPQSHRCFWNGLLTNSTTFTQQYTTGLRNQKSTPTFTLSNVYFVMEQVILPDALTAKIIREAIHADMSMLSKTWRTYESTSLAQSTSQNIQIPVKLASCDSLYMLFQVNEMIGSGNGPLGAYIPYLYDSNLGVCPYGAFSWAVDSTSFIGTANALNPTYIPTSGNSITAQLILGNDVVPQQPYSTLAEMATELVKTGHGWNARDSLIRLMASVIPLPTDSPTDTIASVYDIFTDQGFATTWVSPWCLNDQTIINNASMQYLIDPSYKNTAPLFSGQVPDPNSYAVVSSAGSGTTVGGAGSGAGTTIAHAAGPMTTPNICATPVGGYMINQFTAPRSSFILGFDLNSLPGSTDVATSGRYLGNVPTFLQMTGAALPANLANMGNPSNTNPNMTMLTLAICDMRASFQAGGVVNTFI